jgi:hypothetical protein
MKKIDFFAWPFAVFLLLFAVASCPQKEEEGGGGHSPAGYVEQETVVCAPDDSCDDPALDFYDELVLCPDLPACKAWQACEDLCVLKNDEDCSLDCATDFDAITISEGYAFCEYDDCAAECRNECRE